METELKIEEKIRKNFSKIGFEDGTESRLFPMADSNISNVVILGSAIAVLIWLINYRSIYLTLRLLQTKIFHASTCILIKRRTQT